MKIPFGRLDYSIEKDGFVDLYYKDKFLVQAYPLEDGSYVVDFNGLTGCWSGWMLQEIGRLLEYLISTRLGYRVGESK